MSALTTLVETNGAALVTGTTAILVAAFAALARWFDNRSGRWERRASLAGHETEIYSEWLRLVQRLVDLWHDLELEFAHGLDTATTESKIDEAALREMDARALVYIAGAERVQPSFLRATNALGEYLRALESSHDIDADRKAELDGALTDAIDDFNEDARKRLRALRRA